MEEVNVPHTRYILRGANPLVAEKYAAEHEWSPIEWFYVGGGPNDELIVIDLDEEEAK